MLLQMKSCNEKLIFDLAQKLQGNSFLPVKEYTFTD